MTRASFGIVGANGATGRAVAAHLAKTPGNGVLLGGRDFNRLTACAAACGGRTHPLPVDIQDPQSLDAFCRECTIVINCGGPVTVLQDRVAQSALRSGCHYVDPAGMAIVKQRMVEHNQAIVDRGLSFVVSAGWMPGVTDLLPVYAYSRAHAQMDTIQTSEVFFSDSGDWSDSALIDAVSHLRTVGVSKPGYFRNGAWVRAKTSEASRKVDVGRPVGLRRFSLFYTPELSEVGRRFAGSDFRSYSYMAGVRNALDAMMIAMLPLSERSAVQRLRNIFRRNRIEVGGFVIAQMHGRRRAEDSQFRCCITFDTGRDQWMNGLALAITARLLSEGRQVQKGVHYLFDAVDPAVMLEELRSAGVSYSET